MTTIIPNHRQHQWRVILPIGVGLILILVGDMSLYAVLPVYSASKFFTLETVGLILSANRLIRLISNPIVGLLLDKSRRRVILLCGFGLGAVSTYLYVLASEPVLFIAGRLLWGISWSMIYVGGYTAILDITSRKDRGWGSGVFQTFFSIASSIDPLLGSILNDRLGLASALTVCAILGGVSFLVILLTLPETRPLESVAEKEPGRKPFHLSAWLADLKPLLNIKNLSLNYVNLLTQLVCGGIMMSTVSLYMKQQYGQSVVLGNIDIPIATVGGAMLSLMAIVSALSALVAGSLSDRANSRWTGINTGMAAGIAGLALIGWGGNIWLLLTGVFLVAINGGITFTIVPALVRDLNHNQQNGRLMGVLATSADAGMAIAPLVVYGLLSTINLSTVYFLTALVLLSGVPLILVAARRD